MNEATQAGRNLSDRQKKIGCRKRLSRNEMLFQVKQILAGAMVTCCASEVVCPSACPVTATVRTNKHLNSESFPSVCGRCTFSNLRPSKSLPVRFWDRIASAYFQSPYRLFGRSYARSHSIKIFRILNAEKRRRRRKKNEIMAP